MTAVTVLEDQMWPNGRRIHAQVDAPRRKVPWDVDRFGGAWYCTCFPYNAPGKPCSHITKVATHLDLDPAA